MWRRNWDEISQASNPFGNLLMEIWKGVMEWLF
jgi:hypothetical protein